MSAGVAWYDSDKKSFIETESRNIVNHLTGEATRLRWHIETEQQEEWEKSVDLLQKNLDEGRKAQLIALRQALSHPDLEEISDVILEYDFRRRGLRMDCILLAPGTIIVIEFKRTKLTQSDRDQVMNYCVNLAEFHEATRKMVEREGNIIPMLALTEGKLISKIDQDTFYPTPLDCILEKPLECDSNTLHLAILSALKLRRSKTAINRDDWLNSRFSPSSTILDAAISLYGQHDVSAIQTHSNPVGKINRCVEGIKKLILKSQKEKQNCVIILSGAPGAGKTLVGLNLVFDESLRQDTVFVTGNAPLVDVLSKTLERSYKRKSNSNTLSIPSGYSHKNVHHIVKNSTFKIVKAHRFLKERGTKNESTDGQVLVFDEAQRTYAKGKEVNRERLPKNEAELILESMETKYIDEEKGCVIVALIGHNQVINSFERGTIAWFEAAEERGWKIAISDETLQLNGLFESQENVVKWRDHALRIKLDEGHLSHSIRYYRNQGIEEWVHHVMAGDSSKAKKIVSTLKSEDRLFVTRDFNAAKSWIRKKRIGDQRVGMVASSGARRLIAEGIYVQPQSESNIAHWMLAPSGDVRSSNMLETAMTEYKIQGLEIDYSLVCWDADLRFENGTWKSYRVHGSGWSNFASRLEVRKNTYRVLLTRARKGMIIFIPEGDNTNYDETRNPEFYDGIYEHLIDCGAMDINQLK